MAFHWYYLKQWSACHQVRGWWNGGWGWGVIPPPCYERRLVFSDSNTLSHRYTTLWRCSSQKSSPRFRNLVTHCPSQWGSELLFIGASDQSPWATWYTYIRMQHTLQSTVWVVISVKRITETLSALSRRVGALQISIIIITERKEKDKEKTWAKKEKKQQQTNQQTSETSTMSSLKKWNFVKAQLQFI